MVRDAGRVVTLLQIYWIKAQVSLTAKCKLHPGQKQLSAAVNITANLSKNVQRQDAKPKPAARDPQTQSDAEADCVPTTYKGQSLSAVN